MKNLAKNATIIAILTISAFAFTACGNAESNDTTNTEETTEVAEATYACPMDCEKGKTYSEPGSCPVCGMDLKEVNN